MLKALCLTVILAPLLGSIIAGFFGKRIGHLGASGVTIAGVGVAFLASLGVLVLYHQGAVAYYNILVYNWGTSGGVSIPIGFLIDPLSILMMLVVTFVSLMVHIYTIGYMHDDPGFERFFSYIALFTFSMLMLVMSDNFLQLFFGWEAVGLVSYLLIGFWYKKPSATFANLKAFLVNRVGDLGFLLGIAAVFLVYKNLNYLTVFEAPQLMLDKHLTLFPGLEVSYVTAACILLFIGAMGKSAQVPLHVWLPDSMEGPTPISALIHAATMVTAGIFMVSRLSPLFELSDAARSFILVIGATTALFMGFLGIVQNDIKRIIAYSTLSQLGYMVVALGASAYAAGIFHLMTHAFFKALLFLGAGSVIIAMHHEQDIRKMGGLYKLMPITYACMVIGSLALAGIPPLSGFYSKDLIIEAVKHSSIPGSGYALVAVTLGVFVTAMYSFRLLFMVFHTHPRMDKHTREHIHETPWVVTGPLIALAVPSVLIGAVTVSALMFKQPGYFGASLVNTSAHHLKSVFAFTIHAPLTLPFWVAISGVVTAWLCYERFPKVPEMISHRFSVIYKILLDKYGFDRFNEWFFMRGSRALGQLFWEEGDVKTIDGVMVNGSARTVGKLAGVFRHLQTGLLNQYAFIMILGLLSLMSLCFYYLIRFMQG